MKQFFTYSCILFAFQLMAQAPVNDDCNGAIELFIDDNNIYEVTSTMINDATLSANDILYFDGDPANPNPITFADKDVWFKFTTTTSFVQIKANIAQLYLYKANDCNALSFVNLTTSSFNGSQENAILMDITIGDTYYIRIFNDAPFDIELVSDDPCGNIANPFTVKDVITNNEIAFDISGGNAPYYVYQFTDYEPHRTHINSSGIYTHPYVQGAAMALNFVDALGCRRAINYPGIMIVNLNKIQVADYKMSVFPNPANYASKLSLSVEKATEMQIQITNIAGQVLSNEVVFVEGDMAFDLKISDLLNGVYFVSAISENGIQTKELLINR